MVSHRRTSLERDPELPTDLDLRELPRAVRAELRGLRQDAAEHVGAHLLMAGQLVDTDPQLAFAHAEAARRRASRLPIVREASAETAYAAGEYQHALSEYRALRRMTGGDDYLPVMADCERALGRLQEALALTREAAAADLDADGRAEALMVEAGVREDMGQPLEGLRLLKTAVRQPVRGTSRDTRARLAYAYADLLLRTGDESEASRWFATAAEMDTDQVTDAGDRLAQLQGLVLELDDEGVEPWAPEEEDPQHTAVQQDDDLDDGDGDDDLHDGDGEDEGGGVAAVHAEDRVGDDRDDEDDLHAEDRRVGDDPDDEDDVQAEDRHVGGDRHGEDDVHAEDRHDEDGSRPEDVHAGDPEGGAEDERHADDDGEDDRDVEGAGGTARTGGQGGHGPGVVPGTTAEDDDARSGGEGAPDPDARRAELLDGRSGEVAHVGLDDDLGDIDEAAEDAEPSDELTTSAEDAASTTGVAAETAPEPDDVDGVPSEAPEDQR